MATTPAGRIWFGIAALAGTLHALASLYWGLGGTWLLDTVGRDLVSTLRDSLWVLLLVGVVKLLAAWLPWSAQDWPGPSQRAVRGVSWAGSVVLVAWGGINTVTANLVLAGLIMPDRDYDRTGMIGHAWLWDPLFLLWGAALITALLRSRTLPHRLHRRPRPTPRGENTQSDMKRRRPHSR